MTKRKMVAKLKSVRVWNLGLVMSSEKVTLDAALNAAIASCDQRTVVAARDAVRRCSKSDEQRAWADELTLMSAAFMWRRQSWPCDAHVW